MATATQVQVLYTAYFGRPADPDGLAFWVNGVEGTNEELDQLADSFADTPEYLATILGLSTEEIVDLFYQNMFSRIADQEGQDFWVNGIISGVLNPQDIGVDIGLAALNQDPPNSDTVAIAAKADAANKYTKALEANPADKAAYSGSEGIKAGRDYLAPVTDAATIPSDADVANSINSIPGSAGGGGGGVGGANPGDVVNGVLNLSVLQDVVTNVNTQQYQIVNGAQGTFVRSNQFALTDGNQSVAAVASDNNLTNTLNTLDSLVDASGTDSDTLTITASGGSNLQSATVTNIENIAFNLAGYTGGTLIAAAAGINATGGLDNITTTGSFTAGTAVIDATGTGASSINTAGLTASSGGAFTITADGVASTITGSAANETITGSALVDTISGAAGNDDITGGDSADNIDGGAGDDTFRYTVAQFVAGETLTGGGGTDTVIFSDAGTIGDAAFAAKTLLEAINLANGTNDFTLGTNAAAATATLTVTGGTGADTINASSLGEAININAAAGGANILTGSNQADTITGGAGADTVTGGIGSDSFTGNGGSNDYIQTGQVNAANAFDADTITDFVVANTDQIGNWDISTFTDAGVTLTDMRDVASVGNTAAVAVVSNAGAADMDLGGLTDAKNVLQLTTEFGTLAAVEDRVQTFLAGDTTAATKGFLLMWNDTVDNSYISVVDYGGTVTNGNAIAAATVTNLVTLTGIDDVEDVVDANFLDFVA